MQTIDWTVAAAGLAGIALVNWYFFRAGRGPAAAVVGGSVDVVVRGGYTPSDIRARAGQPLKLVLDRQDTSSCSEEIVFPDFGIRKFLPPNQKTTIEITPPRPGTYEFMCGMGMLHGRVVAE
jgi:plastocyanin domain-containing protein